MSGPTAVADHRVRARRWTGPVLVAASVLALVVHLYGLYRLTGPPSVSWFPGSDKLEHALGFGLPVFLILLTLDRYGRCTRGMRWLVVGVFAVHAVVSELIQHWFYTSRTGDPGDVLADWLGVSMGWLGYWLIRRRRAVRS
jgi:hypothetical protein